MKTPSIIRQFPFVEKGGRLSKKAKRNLAVESPIALTFNGVSHVVMMASPSDLEDFALGFSLSEEIVTSPKDITSIKMEEFDGGFLLKIQIPNSYFKKLIHRERNLVGQTGCGLCGVSEMKEAVRKYPKIESAPKVSKGALLKIFSALPDHQPLNKKTASVHAAGFCSPTGEILTLREDVGRHNAFDKLIGAMARAKHDPTQGFAFLTSRCSFELVQKALAVKIPVLATISAPTTLAVELAKSHDLTLVCLARKDSYQVYNDPFELFPKG